MILILMGVTGSGKTTIGSKLARELGWEFHDGDNFHSSSNIAKMKQGIPLTDEDRLPWLLAIQEFMKQCLKRGRNVIIACSALKKEYRKLLLMGEPGVQFVHLKGSIDIIRDRMEKRKGHYMNPKLVDSQFATLEEPLETEALSFDVAEDPDAISSKIKAALNL
jgi:gluconokinase